MVLAFTFSLANILSSGNVNVPDEWMALLGVLISTLGLSMSRSSSKSASSPTCLFSTFFSLEPAFASELSAELVQKSLLEFVVVDQGHCERLLPSILQGCADVVDGFIVNYQEPVMEITCP